VRPSSASPAAQVQPMAAKAELTEPVA
jgi:hypothetical protein